MVSKYVHLGDATTKKCKGIIDMKLGIVVICGEGSSCDWAGAGRPLGGWPQSLS